MTKPYQFELDGKTYAVPGLSDLQLEHIRRLAVDTASMSSQQRIQQIVVDVHAILSNHYPELTIERVRRLSLPVANKILVDVGLQMEAARRRNYPERKDDDA